MKKEIKSTISCFRLLIEHTQKGYEPSPEHILKRMLIPLCAHFHKILESGTKNDAWEIVEGFSQECKRLRKHS